MKGFTNLLSALWMEISVTHTAVRITMQPVSNVNLIRNDTLFNMVLTRGIGDHVPLASYILDHILIPHRTASFFFKE